MDDECRYAADGIIGLSGAALCFYGQGQAESVFFA